MPGVRYHRKTLVLPVLVSAASEGTFTPDLLGSVQAHSVVFACSVCFIWAGDHMKKRVMEKLNRS